MTIEELCSICAEGGRRPYVIKAGNSGAVAVAGMEGRVFYVHNGKVVSLFRPEAATHFSNSVNGYFNPGGDGLWPAPEGTCFGYEYAAGNWRVPMGLVNAQYEVTRQEENHLVMCAEVDLINSRLLGIPVRFSREVTVHQDGGRTLIDQVDGIEYIGNRTLQDGEFLLTPWSLCQFSVTPDARASFAAFPGTIRDLYDSSAPFLKQVGDTMELAPNGEHRIQLALPEEARFVSLVLPQENLRITRVARPLEPGVTVSDIADAPIDAKPQAPVRFSIYSDPSGFMELEIAGGCKAPLVKGTVLKMASTTTIESL